MTEVMPVEVFDAAILGACGELETESSENLREFHFFVMPVRLRILEPAFTESTRMNQSNILFTFNIEICDHKVCL
jgi:hypothetical protein